MFHINVTGITALKSIYDGTHEERKESGVGLELQVIKTLF